MNLYRIWGVTLRSLYNFRHSYDRIADAFYWPAMNILLWGFTTVYVANAEGSLSFIVISVLSGIILWMLVWRSQYEITVNLLEEMWNDNMMNLFASPLRVREWILGVFILGEEMKKILLGVILVFIFVKPLEAVSLLRHIHNIGNLHKSFGFLWTSHRLRTPYRFL